MPRVPNTTAKRNAAILEGWWSRTEQPKKRCISQDSSVRAPTADNTQKEEPTSALNTENQGLGPLPLTVYYEHSEERDVENGPECAELGQDLVDYHFGDSRPFLEHPRALDPPVQGICSFPAFPVMRHQYALPANYQQRTTRQHRNLRGTDPLHRRTVEDIMKDYRDVYLEGLSPGNQMDCYNAFIRHVLNHSFKTLSRREEGLEADKLRKEGAMSVKGRKNDCPTDSRYLGFTPAAVLVLCPFRSCAHKVVKTIIDSCKGWDVRHYERFTENFRGPKHRGTKARNHWVAGNAHDNFIFGVRLREREIGLFCPLLEANIIIGSPLGLVLALKRSEKEGSDGRDWLSSIEVLVIDQLSTIELQNREHLETVLQQMNQIPKKQNNTNFFKVKDWFLSGRSGDLRQNIVITRYSTPYSMNCIERLQSRNYAGWSRLRVASWPGVLEKAAKCPLVFKRIASLDLSRVHDIVFDHFTKQAVSGLKDGTLKRTLIFVDSYFDYVRIRNHFDKHDYNFEELCEYTSPGDADRSRQFLKEGRTDVVIYSGRAHFFIRPKSLQGVERVVFYSLPDDMDAYFEIASWVQGDAASVEAYYTAWDVLKLERIVGTGRLPDVLASDVDTWVFERSDE